MLSISNFYLGQPYEITVERLDNVQQVKNSKVKVSWELCFLFLSKNVN